MGIKLSKVGQVLGEVGRLAEQEAGEVADAGKDLAKTVGGAAKRDLGATKDTFVNLGGAAIGYSEMLGLSYSVQPYRAVVSPTLTRGSRLQPGDMDHLKSEGFKGVVNLCAENDADSADAARLGLSALHLPIVDNTAPTEEQMKQFLDFASAPANQPAYVHCEKGQGRTGVAVACYRMAVEGWSADKAVAEARQFGTKMPDQIAFIRQFGQDLGAGRIAGYPLSPSLAPMAPDSPQAIDRELDIVTGSKATDGNTFQTFIDGENALPQILGGLDSAKTSICYETYNFLPGDKVAEEVADHLIAAQQRGVKVRVAVDAFGAREFPLHGNPTLDRMRAAGIEVASYNPINSLSDLNPNRDHRKEIVIDGQTGFLGGMNTGEEFMGGPDVPRRFHDMFARVQGPAVQDMAAAFVSSWKASGGGPLSVADVAPKADAAAADGVRARIVTHVPGKDENIRAAYLTLIDHAQDHIDVENSFPMTDDLVSALEAASGRGVKVRYIVGSDMGMLGAAARDNYQKLLDAGVKIYVYPTRVHTKSLSVDGKYCTFGSSNVDNVALAKNREIISLVEDPKFCAQYEKDLFERDLVGDPQGQKTLELPPELHESVWQKVRDALLQAWPDSLQ